MQLAKVKIYKMISLFLCLVFALSLTACGENNKTNSTSRSQSIAGGSASENAEAIYKQSCIACRGTDLRGTIGPNLQHVGSKLSKDKIMDQIENRRGGMPSFQNTYMHHGSKRGPN